MKIVIVIDLVDSKTNGSVMTALRFRDGLKSAGHEVSMVAIGADGQDDCNLEERYIPLVTEVSAKSQVKFGKFNREKIKAVFEGADIVHFIFPFKLEKECKKLADKMGIPTTSAFHVQPENFSYNIGLGAFKPLCDFIYMFFRRGFYKNFDSIHCPSKVIADQLVRHGYKSKIYVISNGYDSDFVPPVEKTKNEKFEIVMVGRLSPEKNQQVIISAIAQSKYKDNIHLSLLGNGTRKKKLQKKAKKSGVDTSFDFLYKTELISKLQKSDLYIHSAEVETEAIACIEAIACGLVPVIANSRLSATPQFAIDDRSLFENNNPASLAEKIDYWYEHEEERLEMGKKYAVYATQYSLSNSIKKAEQMFSDQIERTKNNRPV